MRRRARVRVSLWTLACACAGGDATSLAGADSEPTQTGAPPTGTTEVGPTSTDTPPGGTGTGTGDATSLDPTNAFTDSSQLTEAPADTGTGEPPAPHVCEASNLCFEPDGCVLCSIGSDCADEFAACEAVPSGECKAYSDCVSACGGDAMCAQNCYLAYPNGYDPAWALADCSLCDVCQASCAAYSSYCANGGGGPGKTETCDQLGDCAQCSSCSAFKDCAGAVQACQSDPQCQPYQTCINACLPEDPACIGVCGEMYPGGYLSAWAQFDCAVCTACPASCAPYQPYCQGGGGGPNNACSTNGDCVEISDSLPYCVSHQCVECLINEDCFDPAFPTCVGNFCH